MAHGVVQDGNVPGVTHMAHLLPLRPGSLTGLLPAKAVAEPRRMCQGAAPPWSQNNQGQNWWHQAKSHREGLLRLYPTSGPRGRHPQHPCRGHHPSQHPNIPCNEQLQQQRPRWEQSEAMESQNAGCAPGETDRCQKARAFCCTQVLKDSGLCLWPKPAESWSPDWILLYRGGSLEDTALESKDLGLICTPCCP